MGRGGSSVFPGAVTVPLGVVPGETREDGWMEGTNIITPEHRVVLGVGGAAASPFLIRCRVSVLGGAGFGQQASHLDSFPKKVEQCVIPRCRLTLGQCRLTHNLLPS